MYGFGKLLPAAQYNVISFIMPSAIEKPRRAKKGTGTGRVVGVRLRDDLLQQVDVWAAKHRAWSRPEAVRRLLATALTSPPRR